MVFAYEFDRLNTSLERVLKNNLSPDAWKWLENEGAGINAKGDVAKFNIAFVAMPRKTGKDRIEISSEDEAEVQTIRPGLMIRSWTRDRLARVWLLMQLKPGPAEEYSAVIENLFLNAEMSELVALYSALPVFAHPESWRKRCAEGIRSNIGQVLEAVICNNPYPSEQLDEAAWNQLVLKAIFTEKPMLEIIGLKERRNEALAHALSDYAHERWAAHRDVNPLLWLCIAPFVDELVVTDLQRLFASGNQHEREAAALVCYESKYGPAKELLEQHGDLKNRVQEGSISWESVAGSNE